MIPIDEDDVIVGKRLIYVGFNPDGSENRVDSTDIIYESFENAFMDIHDPIKILYGGITDDTVADEFRGKITFKRKDFDEDNIGHGTIFDVYRDGKRVIEYAILPIIANKLQYITYRGMFIKPFNIDKYLICRKDGKELTIKKSLELALSYVDMYLTINPVWQ